MKTHKNILIGILIIAIAVVFRIVQPIDNFAPIVAVTLFAGYLFNDYKKGLILAVLASFIGDIVISYIHQYSLFHDTFVFVYGSYALIAFLGTKMSANKFSWGKLATYGLVSSLLFFVITNLGVFLMSNLYSKDLSGLVNCFVAAIPFYKYSFISDLLYIPVIFSVHQYINSLSNSFSGAYIQK